MKLLMLTLTFCMFALFYAAPLSASEMKSADILDTYSPEHIYKIKPLLIVPTISLDNLISISPVDPSDYHIDYTMKQDGNYYDCSLKYGCSLSKTVSIQQAYLNKNYHTFGFLPWLERSLKNQFVNLSTLLEKAPTRFLTSIQQKLPIILSWSKRQLAKISSYKKTLYATLSQTRCTWLTELFGCNNDKSSPQLATDNERKRLMPTKNKLNYPYNDRGLYLDSTRDTFVGVREIILPKNFQLQTGSNGRLSSLSNSVYQLMPVSMRNAIGFSRDWDKKDIECVTFAAMVYNHYGINLQDRLGDGGSINLRTDIFNVKHIELSTTPPQVGDLLDSKGHVSVVSKVSKQTSETGSNEYIVECLQGNTPDMYCQYTFKTQGNGTFIVLNNRHDDANLPFAWMTKKPESQIKAEALAYEKH